MSDAGFTAQLAKWVASAQRAWEAKAIEQAQRAIVDTVGCMIAGVNDEAHGIEV